MVNTEGRYAQFKAVKGVHAFVDKFAYVNAGELEQMEDD